jgi:MFS family permease
MKPAVLAAVSLLTSMSSEMLAPARILFLVAVLRLPLITVGLIEGAAISISILVRTWMFQLISDANPKPLALLGYGLSTIARPMLALAASWIPGLFLVVADAAGRSVGDKQRDTLLTATNPRERVHKAFSLQRSMIILGAILGPIFTYLIFLLTSGNVRMVLLATILPGILAVLLLLVMREQPAKPFRMSDFRLRSNRNDPKSKVQNLKSWGLRFWMFTAVSTVFALGNISVAFLALRGAGLDKAALLVPLMYLAYKLTHFVLARPLGALSERWGRLPVLVMGQVALALIYTGWAHASVAWHSWALFIAYGAYIAAISGVARGFAMDIAPTEVGESALRWFSTITGLAAIPGNVAAGWLWSLAGPGAAFTYGAWAAMIALTFSVAWLPWLLGKGYLLQPAQVNQEVEPSHA